MIALVVRIAHKATYKATHLRQAAEPIADRLLEISAIALIVRTAQEVSDDDATHMAAGVAYYAILSLFPLMVGLIALLGMFIESESVQRQLFDFFHTHLPASTDELEANVEAIADLRGPLGILGILGLFWTASAIFGGITRAVNRASDGHKDRPFYVSKLRSMAMAMGVSLLFLTSVSLTNAIEALGSIDLPVVGRPIFLENNVINVVIRALPFVFSLSIFMLIYKYLPNTPVRWKYVWPGAILAAVSFEIAKNLFVFYLHNFADYEKVYGSLGSIIALLVWIYVSAFILIVGAEFSSEYGRMREGIARGKHVIPD
ncbi:MAG: YihY/virulence factor BrkB family protein [Dehalococcoidia bacterium]|nr:YihY/virulence factor BrkB family protein [Dehalococcoidia bacterium]